MRDTIRSLVKNNIRSACTNDTLLHLCVSRLNIIRSGYFNDGTIGKRVSDFTADAIRMIDLFETSFSFSFIYLGNFSQFESRQIIAGL